MNQEEIDKLQAELNEYKKGKVDTNEKVLSILTAGKSLSKKNVTYYITDDISIDVLPYVPRDVRNDFIEKMENVKEEGVKSLTSVEDIYAEFMSKMCIDDNLKTPEVWIEFNNISGKLISLASFIFKDLTISEKDMSSFRRK